MKIRFHVYHTKYISCCALLLVGLLKLNIPIATWVNRQVAREGVISSLMFSPDGKTIITGSTDTGVKLWDVQTGKIIRTLHGQHEGVTSAAFSPDGQKVLTGGIEGNIELWDRKTGMKMLSFDNQTHHPILSISFSPDGRKAVSGGTDYNVRVWDIETGRQDFVLLGHRGPVKSVSFSADGKMVLSAGGDKKVGGCCKWWDIETRKEIGEIYDTDYIKFAAFTPDGKRILIGSGRTLKLWDTKQRNRLLTLDHRNFVDCAALSHDGKLALSAGSSGTINIWNIDTGRLIIKLKGHNNTVFSLSFSPDDRTVLSGAADGTIKLWEVITGVEIRSFPTAAEANPVASIYYSKGALRA